MEEHPSAKKTLKELYLGIAIAFVLFAIVGSIFVRPLWIFIPSLITGCAGAGLMAYNMYQTIEQALDRTAEGARKFVTIRSILRSAACIILLFAGLLIHWSAFVGVAVGLLTLKIAAFINPLIGKYNLLDRMCKHS